MKKLSILAVAAIGVLSVPGTAMASHSGDSCSYTGSGSGPYVHTTTDGSGTSGDADAAAGICIDNGDTPAGVGGTGEVGAGSDAVGANGGEGAYAVIDGDNDNADPADGYVGLSNYENGSFTSGCTSGPDQGQPGTTNSGGCFGVDGGPWAPIPGPICGNTSGPTWDATNRDGCSNP